ncbi:SOS response-associated peptidase [Chitinophaga pendula]|uniref:SOS response-associated peptidase n=1 Tax=Chitinophaga TaxID=79328 RepID=UPI0012FE3C67|nr:MULTISPECIES: SOS response-associated peptidase family protein [Chitinophaga]UCJ07394.1 SOS response-associated peptidase [Chitinophaga pendula]
MCYDLAFSTEITTIYELLPELKTAREEAGGELFANFEPTWHKVGQGYPKWPVVTAKDGKFQLHKFEWGVIAPYMKTPEEVKKGRKWMVNARAEKVLEPNTFWNRIRKNRCLVATTGFFEHREIPGWKNKVPYFIRVKDREMFFLAGLYQYSHFPNVETGELPGTFTVITREANTVMKQIHNGGENGGRMPLILPVELEKEWLNPNLTDLDIKHILDYAIPSEQLEHWPVNSVRKTKPDDASVITPAAYEGLPALAV